MLRTSPILFHRRILVGSVFHSPTGHRAEFGRRQHRRCGQRSLYRRRRDTRQEEHLLSVSCSGLFRIVQWGHRQLPLSTRSAPNRFELRPETTAIQSTPKQKDSNKPRQHERPERMIRGPSSTSRKGRGPERGAALDQDRKPYPELQTTSALWSL